MSAMAYGVGKSKTHRLRSEALDYLRCISLAKVKKDPRRAQAKRDKAGSRARKNQTKEQKTEQKLDDQKGGKVQRSLDSLNGCITWRYPVLLPLLQR